MTAKAANFMDSITSMGDDAPAFGDSLPELGKPQMENEDRSELRADPDPRISTKLEAQRMVELVMGDNAAAKIAALPAPGEAVHIRMDGSFNGVDLVFGLLKLVAPATVRTLHLASLSFNRRVGERLLEAIDAGHVGRCVFLSSSMFQGKEKWLVEWLAKELDARGSRLITARNHCKLMLAETTDNRHVVMEGSHNLRTCYCWEQATFYDSADLYAAIERDELERPIALLPLRSDRTRPQRLNGQLVYETRIGDGQPVTLAQGDVLHTMHMSLDGITGLSPIQYARQTVGLSLATSRYASMHFSNSGNVGGIISTPPMSPEALKKWAREWREKYVGITNLLKVAVMPDGFKFTPTSTDPEKSQMLATRTHQVREICRIFRVAPHLVGDIEKASYASLEVQNSEFYQQTIQPWITKIEHEGNRKLFLEVEKPTLELKFNMDAMLRATTRERYAAHAQATGAPFMTTNEARAKEGLEPIKGGDDLLRPLNHGPTKPGGGAAAIRPAARHCLSRSPLSPAGGHRHDRAPEGHSIEANYRGRPRRQRDFGNRHAVKRPRQ